jgi:integrase
MEPNDTASSPGETTIQAAIQEFARSLEAGNYRTNVTRVLERWRVWLQHERGRSTPAEVTVKDCRLYARHLKQAVRAGDLKASTARTYYSYVRAFCSFCEAEELIASNPAKVNRAVTELPEDPGDVERQFWTPADRSRILRFVDARAHDALHADENAQQAFRDRALVYLLALSGVRSAEVFADPLDDKRDGATWGDLSLADGTLKVFGKSRTYEYAQVPRDAVDRLQKYERVLEPPNEDWPLFPTGHAPSKYRVVREQLPADGYSAEEIERLLDETGVDEVLRDNDLVPPSISKNGARSVMQRLCERADLDIDGEYLKPHGARRGLGHQLYADGHAELAQSALRHASIATTHESYSDIQAANTADRVDDVLQHGADQ